MLHRHAVTDGHWALIRDLLPTRGHLGQQRLFVDAVFWIAKTGAPWRDLPGRFGDWNANFRRFSRWSKSGVWARIAMALGGEPDLEELILDSTIVRAHAHAAGVEKKRPMAKNPAAKKRKDWDGLEAVSPPKCMSPSMREASRSS
jgi:transposase